MQFQVPQFIETEDKIIGPLTLRQFIYLGVTGLAAFGLFFALQTWLWLLVVIVLGSLSASLAFISVNGRPMSVFLLNFAGFVWSPHVFVLEEEITAKVIAAPRAVVGVPRPIAAPTPGAIPEPKAVGGGLKNLWNKLLTTKTAIPKREKPLPEHPNVSQKNLMDRYEIVRSATGEREMAKRIDY